jgi:phosphoribosyl-ATP pyrophosphohydrolase
MGPAFAQGWHILLPFVNFFDGPTGYCCVMSDSLDRLYAGVLAARNADPSSSRTARLLRAGRAKMAKKLAEEAVEVIIDAMHGSRDAVVRESADLLYNLVVLWVSSGVQPKDVWREMDRRERLFGIAEKLHKDAPEQDARRKVVALESRRLHKRR